ncbi:multidrug efflux protein [Methanosarcina vacuolata Z-761]|uniref:Multidrug efflux protein n=2 Tax=Methanosarcina vacuolata TaxID=2215 RepID=A0A0E3Q7F3_9EURY|nr:multidrug efflux protein [Methanosarcina vacuolata Z-761]
MPALRISFIIGAVLYGIAAVLSAMRGQRYVYEAYNSVSTINGDLAAVEETHT